MIKLRQSQKNAFCVHAKGRFLDRITEDMRTTWPTECQSWGQERVPKIVQKLANKASSIGITIEYDIARFVTLAFVLNDPDYYSASWAASVLNGRDLPSRVQMNRLWDEARDRITDHIANKEDNPRI
jgi:hypothetical protein